MNRKELNEIRKAARNMKNENHTFYVEGEKFSCSWNGKSFTWKANGRTYENCTAKEVISWIADGEYIKSYCYAYVAE